MDYCYEKFHPNLRSLPTIDYSDQDLHDSNSLIKYFVEMFFGLNLLEVLNLALVD